MKRIFHKKLLFNKEQTQICSWFIPVSLFWPNFCSDSVCSINSSVACVCVASVRLYVRWLLTFISAERHSNEAFTVQV